MEKNSETRLKRATTNDELRELYGKCYERNEYKMGLTRITVLGRLLADSPYRSDYLDVGCGRAESLELAGVVGWQENIQGIEIVPALAQRADVKLIETATDLPFKDNTFKLVTCLDMLEHILPEETERVLSELWRVARNELVVSVADYSSPFIGYELHINQRSYDEWIGLFGNATKGGMPRGPLGWHATGDTGRSLWLGATKGV